MRGSLRGKLNGIMNDADLENTYLELSNPSKGHHKFYEITVDGVTLIVRFGRIGTIGQTKVAHYPSVEDASRAAEKKIQEKLIKGYDIAKKGERQPIQRREKPSIDEQIHNLVVCGISLSSGLDKSILLSEYKPEDFKEEPYLLLLITLGEERGEAPYKPISMNIWHFDTECIEGPGSYVRIAERLKDLATGDLPIQEIKDDVDDQKGKAWLAFKLDGRKYKLELRVEDDWVDTQVFSVFDSLLRRRGTDKRYTYLNLGGQDCLVGCSTTEELEKLRTITGLEFQWMVD